jgi:hypothetical protein
MAAESHSVPATRVVQLGEGRGAIFPLPATSTLPSGSVRVTLAAVVMF